LTPAHARPTGTADTVRSGRRRKDRQPHPSTARSRHRGRMQPDRNVPRRDNPKGQAKNRANLTTPHAAGALPVVNRRRPLVALLVSAAVAALASPAGAASSPKQPDWIRRSFPCRKGQKSAVMGYSPTHPFWLSPDPNTGAPIGNPHAWRVWFKNPCPGEWLVFANDSMTADADVLFSAQTGTAGWVPAFAVDGVSVTGALLSDTPWCGPQFSAGDGAKLAMMRKGQKPPAGCSAP